VNDLFRILRRNDALFRQHLGVRLGRRDVLAIELAVDVDRDVDLRHEGVGLRGEPPAPHLVAHAGSMVCQVLVCKVLVCKVLGGDALGFKRPRFVRS
jgi:hypothetical protein